MDGRRKSLEGERIIRFFLKAARIMKKKTKKRVVMTKNGSYSSFLISLLPIKERKMLYMICMALM